MHLGSCVAVSAALLPEFVGSVASNPAAADHPLDRTPVLITHGDLDDIVPRQDVDASAASLKARGASNLLCFGVLPTSHGHIACTSAWAHADDGTRSQ